MTHSESFYVAAAGDGVMAFVESAPGARALWLQGEFDLASVPALAEVFARAIAIDDRDLVVDLSQLQFLDASIIGVFVRASEFLGRRGRALRLRSPSRLARRVLEICDLTDFLDPIGEDPRRTPGIADSLSSWVAVPVSKRVDPDPGQLTREKPEPPFPNDQIVTVLPDGRATASRIGC